MKKSFVELGLEKGIIVSNDTKSDRLEHIRDYVTLSDCYDLFNERFFQGRLRGCVLTFEDRGQYMGYYCEGGFIDRDASRRRDEICLNPTHFLSGGDTELLQTLLHEQCHQWQAQFGSPSRSGYHNREWANKMLEVGLTPSTTARPGGAMTGQRVSDYATPDGPFIQMAQEILRARPLVTWFKEVAAIKRAHEYTEDPTIEIAPVVATLAASMPASPSSVPYTPSKIGYHCPKCGINAWGKPKLYLICGNCWESSEGQEVIRLLANEVNSDRSFKRPHRASLRQIEGDPTPSVRNLFPPRI